MVQEPGRAIDLSVANRHGQQLFFANMAFHRRKTPRLKPEPRRTLRPSGGFSPVTWRQAPLLELEPDPELVRARALRADSELIRYCKDVVADHAARHGWSKRQTNDVIRSLRLLQVLQDTPGAKINATDVLQLPRYDANIQSTLDVLDAAGMLIEDRTSNVERYFAGKTGGLPAPMKTQLDTWLAVMLNGSTSAPRQRSRDPQTARIHIMGIAPIVHAWAAAGHQSLAEITAEQVRAALPESGSRRNFAEYGLRSLFTVLKSRKLIFTNPTRGMRVTPVNATVPLPPGCRGDPPGPELDRPRGRVGRGPGRLSCRDKQTTQSPDPDRHHRRPTHPGRPGHPVGQSRTRPAHCVARPSRPDLARQHQRAPLPQQEDSPAPRACRQSIPLEKHRSQTPGSA